MLSNGLAHKIPMRDNYAQKTTIVTVLYAYQNSKVIEDNQLNMKKWNDDEALVTKNDKTTINTNN